jgi:hypothetical protein
MKPEAKLPTHVLNVRNIAFLCPHHSCSTTLFGLLAGIFLMLEQMIDSLSACKQVLSLSYFKQSPTRAVLPHSFATPTSVNNILA